MKAAVSVTTVKAAVRDSYGSADVLRVEEIDKPVPSDDEVLVTVRAASINTADIDQLEGRPRIARLGTGLSKPRIQRLGLDMAGEVEAVGRAVTRFAPGDEVWADLFSSGLGAFAEYVCASESAFVGKPADLTFEQAATVPHSGLLALQALRSRGPIESGSDVLINGAGGCVGPFAIQIAKAHDAEVTGVDHTDKLDMLRSLGVDHVIDYTREDVTGSDRRYDLILDIAATRSVLAFRGSLAERGAYVQVARTIGGFFAAATLGALVSIGGSKKMGVFNWVPNQPKDLDYLADLIRDGRLTPLIDRTYPLNALPDAVRYVADGHARGKVLITN